MLEATGDGFINADKYLKRFGGKDGVVRAYFLGVVNASPDPNVSKACLCALSGKHNRGNSMSAHNISLVTHYSIDEVRTCMAFFCDITKWLVKPESSSVQVFQWAHDWLETSFQAFAVAEMNGSRRESVSQLAERSA